MPRGKLKRLERDWDTKKVRLEEDKYGMQFSVTNNSW